MGKVSEFGTPASLENLDVLSAHKHYAWGANTGSSPEHADQLDKPFDNFWVQCEALSEKGKVVSHSKKYPVSSSGLHCMCTYNGINTYSITQL